MKLKMFCVLALCFAANYASASQSDTLRVSFNSCHTGDEKPESLDDKEIVMKLNQSVVLERNFNQKVVLAFVKNKDKKEPFKVLAIVYKDGATVNFQEVANFKNRFFNLRSGEQVNERIDDMCFDLKAG